VKVYYFRINIYFARDDQKISRKKGNVPKIVGISQETKPLR